MAHNPIGWEKGGKKRRKRKNHAHTAAQPKKTEDIFNGNKRLSLSPNLFSLSSILSIFQYSPFPQAEELYHRLEGE